MARRGGGVTSILRVLLVIALCARGAAALDLARQAEIELRGPLANVVVQAAGGGRTHIAGELASGRNARRRRPAGATRRLDGPSDDHLRRRS
jgi:hypothetical protein